jgi:hypothetical protein
MISDTKCPEGHLYFDDFVDYAKSKGGLKDLKQREIEYLRKRLTVDHNQSLIGYDKFQISMLRWL